jgi:peroxiredoxin Q/BCP
MVELRKRPTPPPAPPPAKKRAAPKSKAKKDAAKAEEPGAEEPAAATDDAAVEESSKDVIAETKAKTSSSPASPPKQGDTIELESFGGEVETNDGQKVTLAQLVQSSKKGVVLFTYPKASTP